MSSDRRSAGVGYQLMGVPVLCLLAVAIAMTTQARQVHQVNEQVNLIPPRAARLSFE